MTKQKTCVDKNKRKAIYIVEKVEKWKCTQKRPKIIDRDSHRPFWDKYPDKVLSQLSSGNRITLYKIENNEIVSFRTRKMPNSSNCFTSKNQASERLEEIFSSFDYTITRNNISVFYKNETYNITAADRRFPNVKKYCLDDDVGSVLDILNIKSKIKGALNVDNGVIDIDGSRVTDDLGKKMIDSIVYDDTKAIHNFKERLNKNPSEITREHLLKFLSYNGACLLTDGRFLAYKYVKDNFHDVHSGKFDYSPGKTVKMPRHRVVEDPNMPCSAGLHIGSWEYSGSLGHYRKHIKVLLCVIDPSDVVSVPYDYDHQKIRCCKITSIKEIDEPLNKFVMDYEEL